MARQAVTAIIHTPRLQGQVAEALAAFGCTVRMVAGALGDASLRLSGARPDIWLVEADLEDPSQVAALEAFVAGLAAGSPVVVATASASLPAVRALLRVGIADVLPLPLVRDELAAALGAATAGGRPKAAGPQAPSSTVLSFLKAGGGAGATTIATQAAFTLADAAAKTPTLCLMDLDIQFGSVAFHLDLPQHSSVLDALSAGEHLDGSMLRGIVAHHAGGIDVLTAPAVLYPLDTIDADGAARLIGVARQEYGTVLIDLPQAWSAWTRALLAASSGIVLVLHPTVPSVRHARRQLETLEEEGLSHIPLTLVANRVQRGLFAKGIPLAEVEAAIKRKIDHVFDEYGPVVADAANVGRCLADTQGGRRAARQIGRIAKLLTAPAPVAAAAATGR
jgi:pilus assembly protein CpaE